MSGLKAGRSVGHHRQKAGCTKVGRGLRVDTDEQGAIIIVVDLNGRKVEKGVTERNENKKHSFVGI